jgi:O-antigen/teichoic acid export membrane protein
VNTVGLVVKLAANAVLIERFGINGAMIATALMYASCLFVLWALAINRESRSSRDRPAARPLSKT